MLCLRNIAVGAYCRLQQLDDLSDIKLLRTYRSIYDQVLYFGLRLILGHKIPVRLAVKPGLHFGSIVVRRGVEEMLEVRLRLLVGFLNLLGNALLFFILGLFYRLWLVFFGVFLFFVFFLAIFGL